MGKSGVLIKRQEKEYGEQKGAIGENILYSENVKKKKKNQCSLISKQIKDQQQQKSRRVTIMTEWKYYGASYHYLIAFKNTEFVMVHTKIGLSSAHNRPPPLKI